jgi:hypothetical protein
MSNAALATTPRSSNAFGVHMSTSASMQAITWALRARKGVVLATGGIGRSRELRERLFPDAARRFSLAPSSNTGDGILAAERVSAVVEHDLDSPALWMPSSVMAQADGHVSVFPHIMLDRAKPGLLAVNKSDRRFVNEADSYHDFVAAMLRSNASASSAPPAFLTRRHQSQERG